MVGFLIFTTLVRARPSGARDGSQFSPDRRSRGDADGALPGLDHFRDGAQRRDLAPELMLVRVIDGCVVLADVAAIVGLQLHENDG